MAMNPLHAQIQAREAWESLQDYNHALMRQLQHEVEEHWKFMHYLKTHYPEALAEWNALNKIKES